MKVMIITNKKTFANKVISIPPSLKYKNAPKTGPQKYNSAFKFLLKGEKFAENEIEKNNQELKSYHNKNVLLGAKKLTSKIFTIQSKNVINEHNNTIASLKKALKILGIEDINNIFKYLIVCKEGISDDINKNEALFILFLDKVSNLTINKDVNLELVNLFSDLNLKEFDPHILYKEYNKKNEDIAEDQEISISSNYFNYCNKFENFLNLKNTVVNNVDPELDFKDAFLLKNEFKFTDPLFIQKNSNKTNFSKSNLIYYDKFPLLYPFKQSKDSEGNLKLTQMTNELMTRYSIDPRNNIRSFVQRLLERCITKHFNAEVQKPEIYMETDNSSESGLINTNLLNESVEFIEGFMKGDMMKDNSFLESIDKLNSLTEVYKTPTFKVNKGDIIENEKYLSLKKLDINNVIKKSSRTLFYTKGFIEFNTYAEKIKFLHSPLKIFGLHISSNKIDFFDADFCNLIEVKLNNPSFNSKITGLDPSLSLKVKLNNNLQFVALQEILNLINYQIKLKDIGTDNLEQPNYNINSLMPKEVEIGKKIFIRTNSFEDTLAIQRAINLPPLTNMLTPKILKPEVKFYNEHFISGIDLILRNTLESFNSCLSNNADYKL